MTVVETGNTPDSQQITPKYEELLAKYEQIGGQIDKLEGNLEAQFKSLIGEIDTEITNENKKGDKKDVLYLKELTALKTLVESLQNEYVAIKKQIERGKQASAGPVQKIVPDTTQQETATNLTKVSTTALTTETIPSTKKNKPPTTRDKLDLTIDANIAKELADTSIALDTARQAHLQANENLFAHQDTIRIAKDALSDLEVKQGLCENALALLQIKKDNLVASQDSRGIADIVSQIDKQNTTLELLKKNITDQQQKISDLEDQTNGLESEVATKKTALEATQTIYTTAFQAEQQAVNAKTTEVLRDIQSTLDTQVKSITTTISDKNTTINAGWANIGRSQDYQNITTELQTITTAETDRATQLNHLLTSLDQDASIRLQLINKRTQGLDKTLRSLGGTDGNGGRKADFERNKINLTTDIADLNKKMSDLDNQINATTIDTTKSTDEQLATTNSLLTLHAQKETLARKKTLLEAQQKTNEDLLQTVTAEYNRTLANANYLEATRQFILGQHTQRRAEIERRQAVFTYKRQVLLYRTLQEQIAKIDSTITQKNKESASLADKKDTDSLNKNRALLQQKQGLETTKKEMEEKLKNTVNISAEVTAKQNALHIANNGLAMKKVQLDQATANKEKTIILPDALDTVITPEYEKLFGAQE